jgi:hypothetical protein
MLVKGISSKKRNTTTILTEAEGEKIEAGSTHVGLKLASFLTRKVPPAAVTIGAIASQPLFQCVNVSLPWKKFLHIASVSSVLLIWPTLYFCVGI